MNLAAEHIRSFDAAKADVQRTWRRELSTVDIKGGTTDDRTVFYTSLYHALLQPLTANDADGRYYGFDKQTHIGQIVVNETVAHPLATVFGKLYRMRFPIRDGAFASTYGPHPDQSGDVTASFECRVAAASPCSSSTTTHHWSMHAYGEAVDLDPRENPYVGCGMTRDKTARSYRNRSWRRPGMVTPAVRAAFASIGWGWGGSWFGSTKDYMHFSVNGH